MTGTIAVTAIITGVAGSLAGLVYIARMLAKAVRTLERYAGLPAAHAALAIQTRQNTEAIDRLTEQMRRLTVVERQRGADP